MRARAAYISSLGTGGIIVASALLMLAMVSALVAFHAWPAGHTAGGSVSAVPLTPSAATPAVHAAKPAVRAPRTATHARAHAAHARTAPLTTAGLSKVPAAPSQGVSRRAVGVFKVPSTVGPATPPVPYPPPSTGPQHRLPPDDHPCGCAPPRPEPPIHLPAVTLPGDVNDTTTGVVSSIPPAPSDQDVSSPVPLPLDTVTATVTDLTR
jgi:hypothetical protein